MEKIIQKTHVSLRIRIDKQSWQKLSESSKLEGRPLAERARWLVEVMTLVVHRCPGFRLASELVNPDQLPAHELKYLKVALLEEVYDILFHLAGDYGMKPAAFARILLVTGDEQKRRLVRKGSMVKKEALIKLILEHNQCSKVH